MTDTSIIQIRPPQRLRREIIAIMSDFANKYRVYRDVNRKNPHITLLDLSEEAYEYDLILDKIRHSIKGVKPFKVYIDGISSFDKPNKNGGPMKRRHNYVIYLRVLGNFDLLSLHEKLAANLDKDKTPHRKFVPHITLSHQDLDKRGFDRARIEYRKFVFKHSFTVNGVYLYTHVEGLKPRVTYIRFSSGTHREPKIYPKRDA